MQISVEPDAIYVRDGRVWRPVDLHQEIAGRVVALSRRGQIPRGHADFEPAPVGLDDIPRGSLLGLWRWLRQRSARTGWRAAIDALVLAAKTQPWSSTSSPAEQI